MTAGAYIYHRHRRLVYVSDVRLAHHVPLPVAQCAAGGYGDQLQGGVPTQQAGLRGCRGCKGV